MRRLGTHVGRVVTGTTINDLGSIKRHGALPARPTLSIRYMFPLVYVATLSSTGQQGCDQCYQILQRAATKSGPGCRQDPRSKWGGHREGLHCEGVSEEREKQQLPSRCDRPCLAAFLREAETGAARMLIEFANVARCVAYLFVSDCFCRSFLDLVNPLLHRSARILAIDVHVYFPQSQVHITSIAMFILAMDATCTFHN